MTVLTKLSHLLRIILPTSFVFVLSCQQSDRLPFVPAFEFARPSSRNLLPFPIDLLTAEDPTTRTGIRLDIRQGYNRDLDRLLQAREAPIGWETLSPVYRIMNFQKIGDDLNTLDGFGLLATLFVPLSAELDPSTLPSLEASATVRSSILLVDVSEWEGGPGFAMEEHLVSFNAWWDPSGYQLMIDPLLPLDGAKRYMVVLTTFLRDVDGRALGRPTDYSRLIKGALTVEGFASRYVERVGDFHSEVLGPAGIDAALAFQFTTMSGADDLLNAVHILESAPTATVDGLQSLSRNTLDDPFKEISDEVSGESDFLRATYRSLDFRSEDEIMPRRIDPTDPLPERALEIEFVLAIPSTPRPPDGYPIAILQHGLGNSKIHETKWRRFASGLVEAGVAVIAMDAIRHGFRANEAYRDNPGILNWQLDLLDFSNPLRTRDSLRQNYLDLWQLSNRVIPGLNRTDLPTCGTNCLDTTRKGYAGESLGSILGSAYTTLDRTIRASVLYVGGAKLTLAVRGEADNRFLFLLGVAGNCPALLLPGGKADEERCGHHNRLVFEFSDSTSTENMFFAVAQTLIDKHDPGMIAMGKYRKPFFDENSRNSVLMIEAFGEVTIPNGSTEILALGFGVPHLQPVASRIPGLEEPAGLTYPISGNHPTTGASYGLVQIVDPKSPDQTAHTYPLTSDEGRRVGVHFLTSALKSGLAEIISPIP